MLTVSSRSNRAWIRKQWAALLPGGVAFLLVATAVLKSFSPVESAVLEAAYELPKWLTAFVVQIELAVATWLLSGRWQRTAKQATQLLFIAFAAFSFYRAVSGYESCGCFGLIRISPWATFALDLIVLAMLAFWRPKQFEVSTRLEWLLAGYGVAAVACALPLLSPTQDVGLDLLAESSGLVILEPEEWIGRPFPLKPHLRPKQALDHGKWIVVLYHRDCPKCQEAKPLYEQLPAGQHVLLIEVPPYGPIVGSHARHARLADEREWFVQAPVEIQLLDGVVVSASRDLPSIDGLKEPSGLLAE
ncbi:MAG: MauE/DoxX family redox-associated membrane protein [Pseudomonadota bacterium]